MTNSSIQYITVNPISKEQIDAQSTKPSYYSTSKTSKENSINSNSNINKPFKFNIINNTSSSSDNEYSCSGHSTSSGSHEYEIQGCRDGRAQVQRVLNKNRRKRVQRSFNDRSLSHRKLSHVSSCNSNVQLPTSKLSLRKLSTSHESLNSDHSRETCEEKNSVITNNHTNNIRFYSYQNNNHSQNSGRKSSASRLSHNSYDSGISASNQQNHNSLSKNFEFCHKYQKESIKKFVQDSHHYNSNYKHGSSGLYQISGEDVINNSIQPTINVNETEAAANNNNNAEQRHVNYFWSSLMQILNLAPTEKPQTQVYSVKKIENVRSRITDRGLKICNPSYGESNGNEVWMADWRN